MVSKKVYLAPDLLIAFIDRAEAKHEQAAAFFRYFAENQYQLFIDVVDLVEVYNHIYTEISPSLSRDFLRTIALSNLNIIYPEESDTKIALKALTGYQTTQLTYPKALMAVLANKRNVPFICTFSYLPTLFGLQMFFLPI